LLPTLTTIKGQQAKSPTMTITVYRADLNQVMMALASFDDLAKAGKAKFEGRKGFAPVAPYSRTVHARFRDPAWDRTGDEPPKPFEVRDLVDPMISD
jgi:hypothetical protein